MKKVVILKANSMVECEQIKKEHPEATLVAWPSSLIPEKWFWLYKIEVEQEGGEHDTR